MLDSFLIVSKQVSVLFLLMLLGYFFGKKRMLTEEAVASLNSIILNVIIPCTIIKAFQVDRQANLMHDLLLSTLSAIGIIIVFYIIAKISVRKLPQEDQAPYALSLALTNCSFMGFPLETALIGPLGIFYGSGYLTVMNIFTFTFGYYSFTRDRRSISVRQILTRPAIISVIFALTMFLLDIRLPSVISETVEHLASICVPVPMMIIGYHLSKVNFRRVVTNRRHWLCTFGRLIVLPLLALALLLLCGIHGNVLMASMIAASCPAASVITILAGRFSQKSTLTAELNAMQTTVSLLTIPIIISIAACFA